MAAAREPNGPADHSAEVMTCAVGPDGTFGVSVSGDGLLKLWDVATGAEIGTLTGHADSVWRCAVSPDGTWIISASGDTTLRMWDAVSGAEIRTLSGHTGKVTGCAVSPDGTFIVSASGDTTLRMWDAVSGAEIRTLSGHTASVTGCAVSPDGTFIVSAGADRTLRSWDVRSGVERHTLIGHAHSGGGCAVSPDGAFIASASSDRTSRFWDAATGVEQATLILPGAVTSVALHPFAPTMMCGDDGGGLHLARVVGIAYGPLIVTAVDLGNGLEIRCPHCNRMIPWKEEYRSREMACPLEEPGCGGPLKVNSFVVGERPQGTVLNCFNATDDGPPAGIVDTRARGAPLTDLAAVELVARPTPES